MGAMSLKGQLDTKGRASDVTYVESKLKDVRLALTKALLPLLFVFVH